MSIFDCWQQLQFAKFGKQFLTFIQPKILATVSLRERLD